ncbi:hypothetical protein [Haloferax sp. Atlit-47N]|uniref:hypothetical protein n=1 Tax=Haloferax sp. Atlit-47N TaxID=2077199 RepID=UPI0011C0191E|nr:hypothetical protein [Haloferax sp. Atlit-47N]
MTTASVQRYASKFPEELGDAVDGISGETERAVFILLFDEGDLAFTEIRDKLGDEGPLHQQTLSTALANLKAGGLIRKRILEDADESPFTSYYSVSEFGHRFIHSLFDSLGSADGPAGRRQVIPDQFSSNLYDSTMEVKDDIRKQLASR